MQIVAAELPVGHEMIDAAAEIEGRIHRQGECLIHIARVRLSAWIVDSFHFPFVLKVWECIICKSSYSVILSRAKKSSSHCVSFQGAL